MPIRVQPSTAWEVSSTIAAVARARSNSPAIQGVFAMPLYTTGAAGILTPEEVRALVVRPLIEQSVAAQVSTVVQTGSHDFRVPVVSADPTAAWTAEGAEITASDPTIAE